MSNRMSKQENKQKTTSQVPRVSLKIPPFWFNLLESQFINCGIVQDSTKYHAVVAAIESNILSEVRGVIMKTPENDMY
jgi:hypothetical protein